MTTPHTKGAVSPIVLTVIVIAVIAIGIGYAFTINSPTTDDATSTEELPFTQTAPDNITDETGTLPTNDEIVTPITVTPPTAGAEAAVKEFTLTGQNFEFSETELRVKKGDTVKISFTSTGGTHDWVVDEFNAATKQVNTGETTEVTFVADEAGTFEYYCGVNSHRQFGMVGNLIVEE